MLNNLKLPVCIERFVVDLLPYVCQDLLTDKYLETSDTVSLQNGKVCIKLIRDVGTSTENYNKFRKDYEAAKKKWALSDYTSVVFHVTTMPIAEIPEQYRKQPNYRAEGIHIEIDVKSWILERLSYFFEPENDMSINDSIELLRKCGMTDLAIMNTLNIPRTSFRRYAKPQESKMDTKETKQDTSKTILDTAQTEQKTELVTIPN